MKNKVVVILGANGRIGSSISKHLNDLGTKTILVDKKFNNKKKLVKNNKNLIREINVFNEEKLVKLINDINKKYGKINAVINCLYPKSNSWGRYEIGNINKKTLDEHFSIHLSNTVIITKHFTNFFLKQKHGNIIYLSSIQGIGAPKFEHYKGTKLNSSIEYSIIKAGIVNMTKYLAKYFKGRNIRFNCISCGGIKDNQPISFKKKYKKSCLSKGLLDAEDLNDVFMLLLSENSKSLNGQNIIVDDGWSL